MDKPILYKYFKDKANELLSQYHTSSNQVASDNLGKNRENFLNSFLKKSLPPRLKVVSGELIDSENNHTGQIDTIIIRDDCPSLDFGNENSYLVEGVFATLEIKSTLNKETLAKAVNSLLKVSKLTVPEPSIKFGGYYLNRPLRILFSYTGIKFGKIVEHINENNWQEVFDLICVLDQGVIARKGKLLFTFDLESGENLNQDIFVNSSAGSLGILYYYLVQYGSSFSIITPNFQKYFEPLHNWNEKNN